MSKNIQFCELRDLISKLDRVSICMKDTLQYENFRYVKEVPLAYDDYYVYGIGLIESEFAEDRHVAEDTITYRDCIEIMLSATPKNE